MRNRQLLALAFAALAVAARLPFLITGKIPFDSDEAVEGLMARHVLEGELPAFFWGQSFKGVPEVYAAAGAFAMFGSSVTVLKGVTLVFFAIYVALNFVLLDRMASRWIAVAASCLLIAAPPALVFWSLDASAEYVVIMMLGTALLFVRHRISTRERTDGTKQGAQTRELLAVGLLTGAGLWVHQLFAVYLIPLGIILVAQSQWSKRRSFAPLNRWAVALGAIAGVYLALGIVAFFSGGFQLQAGRVAISATAPQKMARIAAAILTLAAIVQVASRSTGERTRHAVRRYWPLAAGFVAGYSPALLYSVLVEPARSPARVANLSQLVSAAPDILGNIVPILAGFKIATTERLALPLVAVVPGAAAVAAYLWSVRRRLSTDFFALFVVVYPLLFLASGAYLDTQSYRYFIPWYAGLSIAWASGSLMISGGRKPIAAAIVAVIAGVHIWQQAIWHHKLQPDAQSLATIECLRRNRIRGGYAEYWTAYKLTFLAEESIIIAPTDGIDRYPKYTEYVRSLPAAERTADAGRCN